MTRFCRSLYVVAWPCRWVVVSVFVIACFCGQKTGKRTESGLLLIAGAIPIGLGSC